MTIEYRIQAILQKRLWNRNADEKFKTYGIATTQATLSMGDTLQDLNDMLEYGDHTAVQTEWGFTEMVERCAALEDIIARARALHNDDGYRYFGRLSGQPMPDPEGEKYCTFCNKSAPCPDAVILDSANVVTDHEVEMADLPVDIKEAWYCLRCGKLIELEWDKDGNSYTAKHAGEK